MRLRQGPARPLAIACSSALVCLALLTMPASGRVERDAATSAGSAAFRLVGSPIVTFEPHTGGDSYYVYLRLNRRVPRLRNGSPLAGVGLDRFGLTRFPAAPHPGQDKGWGIVGAGRAAPCYTQELEVPAGTKLLPAPHVGQSLQLRVYVYGAASVLRATVSLRRSHGGLTDEGPERRLGCRQAVAATVAPSSVAPSFGRAITVASAGVPELSAPPAVAVNAAGSSVVAWNALTGIVVRHVSAGGRLGAPQHLGPGFRPEVSIAANGTAAVIWEAMPSGGHGRRLLLGAIALAGKPFGTPQRLLSVTANVPDWSIVATDERVVAVWGQDVPGLEAATSAEIRYAIAAGSVRFGAPRTLALAYYASVGGAGVDAAGDVAVSYRTPLVLGPTPVNAQVAAAVLPAGARTFDAPQVLSAGTQQSLPSSEGDGDAVFSGPGGVAVGYSVEGTLPWLLQVSTLEPDLSYAASQTAGEVPNPPPSITTYNGPVVALPVEGGPVAAWTVGRDASAQAESPVTGALEAAGEQANGAFSAPEQLSPPSTVSQYPVAAATSDSAIVAWGEGRFDRERLVYSVRPAGASFSSPRTLGTGVLRNAALSGAGTHAVIAWIAGHRLLLAELAG